MDEYDGMYPLASVLNIRDLNEQEKCFVLRIYIGSFNKDAFRVPRTVPRPSDKNLDVVDEVNSSEVWGKIRSLMGENDFQKMWNHKLVCFEMPNNVKLSLNGRLILENQPPSSFGKNKPNGNQHIMYISKGYNPRLLVDLKSYVRKKISCGKNVIPTDYHSICELIENQETGLPYRRKDICNGMTPIQRKLLKKFVKKNFSVAFFKQKLLSSVEKTNLPLAEINSFVKNILKSHVPRNLIGSKKAFERMTSNICRCFEHPHFPLRLGTLMKGIRSSDFSRNVFLCKFVLFLTRVFVSRVIYKLFYVTVSSKDKKLLFFKKQVWMKYEKSALQKMVNSGVLVKSSAAPYGPQISKIRILYKTRGFRPLVKASTHLRGIRFRLSVCNAFLKQIVNQINPAYGNVLNALQSQWINLSFKKSDKLYFVRTDVCDAFQSVLHDKLLEILNRRLSALDPVQTCRTFEYKCGKRKKSVLQFTKLCPRLQKKIIFCGAGKKEYTTSYLKAVMIQYIKQNYVSMNGQQVFRQVKGLPQGSYLSSILCELYLADMDDCYLNHLKNKNDALIRGVDDYVYMTTDRPKADTFLKFVADGIPEYGITFQHSKTVTNFGSPETSFAFFGYTFYPMCRKIEPNFSEWTDNITSRMYLNSKMTWDDLTRRMKMVTYIKLHGLILDSNYLHKFTIMKNIYLCSKIHAAKYKAIHDFLIENGNPPPTLTESLIPIIAAANVITSKVLYINKEKMVISRPEIKVIVLKGFEAVLGATVPFRSLVSELRVATGRMLSMKSLSTRFKKLLKSLVKNC